ncbi:MAG TPA: tRNA (adenosine(37)-N6)-threonylcarbamoyltransferase complex transferase subunit TsaD [Acidobacteriota bacterium]|jgi:N6-L-threonylcarbamoyladenine synthase|nr:tRNA (adenosine(37)-N6)-threonylcarbamoyltransferase complex transferase subunit TsaD [Opitutales bacterium]MDP6687677.1 tRNA (adenosine(37)-N6)-threonylcarbamoyltransferase complex transferase subunit TsaD [Acidobacteriota bacterium]MEC8944474.1 tRNA (adenosine(37)-N6)-threonylcarbamoyltransferase complex transferase subunit TsaD [Acidobacteriota bacterium]HJO29922.1 tRNA (adenosine(37)-N6)-threonylcarbamoyltransferase complex transferase subunit TsaD [Acidobacteriota bacterium]|tara:strand:- start:4833 stop:5855 length:1023 start_codon:yes stop_codon:yes gene_type:complete
MLVFGIETSCDETAAAVVANGFHVLSNVVSSQIDHAAYGGVVPELAARRHVENLPWVVEEAFDAAEVEWSDIDGIGVTRGPGLVGALLAGWCYGRGAARSCGIPFVGVNHLEAHVHGALMPTLEAGNRVDYPLLALIVSGGHTMLYRLPTEAEFCLAGTTLDDAAGEAFDKVSTLLGLGYPGGPVIDQLSDAGDPMGVNLPRSRLSNPFDFSFSGIKAAVRREALRQELEPGRPDDQRVLDLAASFQCAVLDMLEASTDAALRQFPSRGLVVAGGVAANRGLRARMETLAVCHEVPLYLSPLELSTDNAAMVAAQAYRRLVDGEADPFDLTVRANWPLND